MSRQIELTKESGINNETTFRLLVGAKKREITASAKLLRQVPFFKACLDSGMRETQEHTIKLPEENLDTIKELLYWLEHNKFEHELTTMRKTESTKDSTSHRCPGPKFKTRLASYRLSSFICSDIFRNAVFDSIFDYYKNKVIMAAELRFIIPATSPGHPLGRYAEQHVAFNIQELVGAPNRRRSTAFRNGKQCSASATTTELSSSMLWKSIMAAKIQAACGNAIGTIIWI